MRPAAALALAGAIYAMDPEIRRRWRDAPIAQVTGGRVRGITTKDNVTAFYGVPYAKAKRYAAAAPTSWSGIRDATLPAEPCPAPGVIGTRTVWSQRLHGAHPEEPNRCRSTVVP